MIDKRIYCETFSRLHASPEAKREVFQMRGAKRGRMPGLLRTAVIAAAMTAALAVTAGAVNLVTDGDLFRRFTIIWAGDDLLLARDQEGNQVRVTVAPDEGTVTWEDGRLLLHANGLDLDITEAMEKTGAFHYEYDLTVAHEDGSQEIRTVAIDVSGDLKQGTVTQDNGDGTSSTAVYAGGEDGPGGMADTDRAAENGSANHGQESG